MAMVGRRRILLVDDDPGVTSFLRRGLVYEGFDVSVAQSGKAGLDLARECMPHLVVLDVMMPGIDGLEVCRRLKAGSSDVAVLMLTARDAVADKVKGLETGADDYLVKPFAFEELLARVRALLRRHEAGVQEPLRCGDLLLDTNSRMARRGTRDILLSTTEFKLLQMFMRNAGIVLTRAQIMEKVWEDDFEGGSNVLEVYVRHLRNKLELPGESRLIHTLRGTGYVLREGER